MGRTRREQRGKARNELRREFEPVIAFVNDEPGPLWRERLWEVGERWVNASIAKDGGIQRIRVDSGELPMQINERGDDWEVAIGHECCGGELVGSEQSLPKILGEEATLSRVQQLRTVLKEILDLMAATVDLIAKQRSGQGDQSWRDRLKNRRVALVHRRAGHPPVTVPRPAISPEPDAHNFDWSITHFEEQQKITKSIEKHLGGGVQRKALVSPSGEFLLFEDYGLDDAGRTLLFRLAELTEEIFSREQPILRKCPKCERFFLEEARRLKKYCSEKCKIAFNNKRWVESGNAMRYMRKYEGKDRPPYKGARNNGKPA